MMFLVFALLQATSLGVSALNNNMTSRRLGKVQLMEDLRAHRAFKEKVSPAGDDNVVNIELIYCHYEVLMVDEVEQTVLSVGYADISWRDPDLAWDQTMYGGVDTISLQYNEIWHPSIRIANTADQDYMMIDRAEVASLSSSGKLRYVTPVHLKTTCDMDLTYYPFDTQICDVFFLPLFDDVKQNISARLLEAPNGQMKVTGQWLVKSTSITKMSVENIGDIEVVRFVMVIKRRPVFYLLCVLAPMILTASVTSVVFWIPPSTGEKISFLVTVFVSDAVFLNFIAELMPRNMTNVPRLPLFLIIISLQCMFALLATIFVMRRYNQEQKDLMSKNEQITDMNKIFFTREEAAQETEPTKSDGGKSHFNASYFSYIFDKLSFPNVRIGPLEKDNKSEKKRKVQRKCQICPLKSSTWDMIFFWLFHAVTIPTYYMLFQI